MKLYNIQNTMNHTAKSLITVIAALAAAPLWSLAALNITQNFVIGPQANIAGPTGSLSVINNFVYFNVSANTFNTSLGTLESVTYTYDMDLSATGTAGSDGALLLLLLDGGFSVDGEAFDGTGGGTGFSGNEGEAINISTGLSGSGEIDLGLSSTILGAINGTGAETYNFTMVGNVFLDAGSLDSNDAIADFDGGTVSLSYTYTPVPEPSSYGILFGLTVIAWVNMRRKSFHPNSSS
ncbi:MAG: PEP-CTERM sorting domain-containing protein [Verrucomicrobiota bacterium]